MHAAHADHQMAFDGLHLALDGHEVGDAEHQKAFDALQWRMLGCMRHMLTIKWRLMACIRPLMVSRWGMPIGLSPTDHALTGTTGELFSYKRSSVDR